MVEEQNDSVTIQDFQNAFPNNESDDSLANAMAAANFFSDSNLSQKDIIDSVKSNTPANTGSLLSKQEAETAKKTIFASVITHIANDPNSNYIFNNDLFREDVKTPISRWNFHPDTREKKEIIEMRKGVESKIVGVLWTLYSDELKTRGISDDFQLAEKIFPDRDYVIRPDTFGTGIIEDCKREIIDSK
jgi:hypothetical protein